MDAAGVGEVLSARWGLTPDGPLRRPASGSNNRTWFLRAGGAGYVVRLYSRAAGVAREHALLHVLGQVPLPFAVPAPVPARDGRTWVDTPAGPLAVFRRIPGWRPRRMTTERLHRAGRALGRLDAALASVEEALARRPGSPIPRHADLDAVDPAIPDVEAFATSLARDARLARDRGLIRWFAGHLPRLRETAHRLDLALPTQTIHGDFAASNTLFLGRRLTGVLDFEFADPDLRALDVAAALYNLLDFHGDGWFGDLDAFCTGYGASLHLTDAEVTALPDLIRLRAAATTLFRAGRWLAGQAPVEQMLGRMAHARHLDGRLERHRSRLVDLVMRTLGPA